MVRRNDKEEILHFVQNDKKEKVYTASGSTGSPSRAKSREMAVLQNVNRFLQVRNLRFPGRGARHAQFDRED